MKYDWETDALGIVKAHLEAAEAELREHGYTILGIALGNIDDVEGCFIGISDETGVPRADLMGDVAGDAEEAYHAAIEGAFGEFVPVRLM